jgi:hypothetical protein
MVSAPGLTAAVQPNAIGVSVSHLSNDEAQRILILGGAGAGFGGNFASNRIAVTGNLC